MDYQTILNLAVDLGYELSISGAETFRIEDSMARIAASYGIKAEVFSIPNYLIVSMLTEDGKPITRMRRIGPHGNNLDAVEKLNALSRKICMEHPAPETAMQWLEQVRSAIPYYGLFVSVLGHFLGALGYSLLFGCGATDMVMSGLCGILGGLLNRFMDKMRVNPFFETIFSAFSMALLAYWLNTHGLVQNVNSVVIGALMILVPGLLFTNAMRDIIYGDTNSGITRFVQVLLISMGMALGTAVAWNTSDLLWGMPHNLVELSNPLLVTAIGSLIGCIGDSKVIHPVPADQHGSICSTKNGIQEGNTGNSIIFAVCIFCVGYRIQNLIQMRIICQILRQSTDGTGIDKIGKGCGVIIVVGRKC